jgi:long-chain acyl-CoA synthetase
MTKYKNLTELVRKGAQQFASHTAMMHKKEDKWQGIRFDELLLKTERLGASLIRLGIEPQENVGIYSRNSPWWAIADYGIYAAGAVTVPVYATNSAAQLAWIVNDAGIRTLFVDDKIRLDAAIAAKNHCPTLENIIVFEKKLSSPGKNIFALDELLTAIQDSERTELERRYQAMNPDTVASIIYTSGTTGEAKGVMLTHGNFDHQIRAVEKDFFVTPKDRSLCFLPLSHVYERSWSYFVLAKGAANWYVSDPKEVLAYLQDARPTIMVSVPRLYEKIYGAVMEKVEQSSALRRRIFHWAVQTGTNYHSRKFQNKWVNPVLKTLYIAADRLALHKVRDVLGGPKNFLSAGGAALNREIEAFFLAAGLLICQGYGLTESSPLITANTPTAYKFGSVGRAGLECEIKIDENGEILAKGPNIMKGYYKNEAATAEALRDGWLHTGDVGFIDEEGYLHITDRIKDLIITSGGKNIAPQRIEMILGQDHYIEQAVAIGEGRKYISALIVPNFPALEEWAASERIPFNKGADLVKIPEVIAFYKQRIARLSVDLGNYEKVKTFALLEAPFSIDSGELTPSLKVKRKVVNEKYKTIIESLYS